MTLPGATARTATGDRRNPGASIFATFPLSARMTMPFSPKTQASAPLPRTNRRFSVAPVSTLIHRSPLQRNALPRSPTTHTESPRSPQTDRSRSLVGGCSDRHDRPSHRSTLPRSPTAQTSSFATGQIANRIVLFFESRRGRPSLSIPMRDEATSSDDPDVVVRAPAQVTRPPCGELEGRRRRRLGPPALFGMHDDEVALATAGDDPRGLSLPPSIARRHPSKVSSGGRTRMRRSWAPQPPTIAGHPSGAVRPAT